LHPEYEDYLDENRELVVLMVKPSYGTIEVALLFQKDLTTKLSSLGFNANPFDPCVFNKMMRQKQVTITIHVDDLKIYSKSKKACEETINFIITAPAIILRHLSFSEISFVRNVCIKMCKPLNPQ
jgi:hypothetical protein